MEYRQDNVHDARMDTDARLAALKAAQAVALVTSLDGSQIFWATDEGFSFVGHGIQNVNGMATIAEDHALARQIASFAAQLPVQGPARLVRLRLSLTGLMEAVTCRAVRFPLSNGACGVLLVALDAPARRPVPVSRTATAAWATPASSLHQTQNLLEHALAAGIAPVAAAAVQEFASEEIPAETTDAAAFTQEQNVLHADFEANESTLEEDDSAESEENFENDQHEDSAADSVLDAHDASTFAEHESAHIQEPEQDANASAGEEELSHDSITDAESTEDSESVETLENHEENAEELEENPAEETARENDVEIEAVTVIEEHVEPTAEEQTAETVEAHDEIAVPHAVVEAEAVTEEAVVAELEAVEPSEPEPQPVEPPAEESVEIDLSEPVEPVAAEPTASEEASAIVSRSGSRVPRRLAHEEEGVQQEHDAPESVSIDADVIEAKPLSTVRLPLRFVWQSGSDGKLALMSPEILDVLALRSEDVLQHTWLDLAAKYTFEDSNRLENALSRRDTWSGVVVHWPIRGTHMLAIELAGLPVFDRERQFQGFRGFGVVRETPRPLPPRPRGEPVSVASYPPPAEIVAPAAMPATEVPPLRSALAAVTDSSIVTFPDIRSSVRAPSMDMSRPDLNNAERMAFSEIARSLGARIADEKPVQDTQEQPSVPAKEETVNTVQSAMDSAEAHTSVEPTSAAAEEHAIPEESSPDRHTAPEAVAEDMPAETTPAEPAVVVLEEAETLEESVEQKASAAENTELTVGEIIDAAKMTDTAEKAAGQDDEETVVLPEDEVASEIIEDSAVVDTQNTAEAEHDTTETVAVDALAEPSASANDDADEQTSMTDDVQEAAAESAAETAPPVTPFVTSRASIDTEILEAMPLAVLVHRLGAPIFANNLFFKLTGFEDLGHLAQHGVDSLFEENAEEDAMAGTLTLRRADESTTNVDVKLHTLEWDDGRASLMLLTPLDERSPMVQHTNPVHGVVEAVKANLSRLGKSADASISMPVEPAPAARLVPAPENNDNARNDETTGARETELKAVLDIASDGVLVVDASGKMLEVNRTAQELFGLGEDELVGRSFTLVLSAESHRAALDYLDGMKANGIASVLNEGREVVGMSRKNGAVPLFMKVGRVNPNATQHFCIVLRDISSFKKSEEELRASKRQAELASSQKSDFLARVSHEVRTPLNAILGFAEVMMEERFGPLGNERYKDYLKDIHASGNHVISLVNDLLDLSKIEAGKLDLDFTSINLNDVVSSAVSLLQPQANRNRIIIRTSLAEKMPSVVADERSLKQIALNLLSNAVKFTPAGGQVIVSTGLTDLGQAVIRVRDSGNGMSEKEIATALEPFRQLATTNASGGTGLGLPLTKALVEANRATFAIQSARDNGTLVEVIFPPTRVLAE